MSAVEVRQPLVVDHSKHMDHEIVVEEVDDISPRFNRSVEDLELEEKVALLSGADFVHSNGVARLGVPILKVRLLYTCSFLRYRSH